MIEVKVTLHAPRGGFNDTTFTEWLGHEIQVTGLDPACRQVLGKAEGRIFHAQRPEYLGGQKLTERAIAAVQPADDLGQYRVRRDRAVADFLTGK